MTNEKITENLSNLALPDVVSGLLNHEVMLEHLKKNSTEPPEFDSLKLSAEERRKRFGARLRMMRRLLGMTQAELASRIGISKAAITTYETGVREAGYRNLIALARTLGVSVDWLLDTLPPVTTTAD